MIKCSKCGADNPLEATFCESCGQALNQNNQNINEKQCPQCGTFNELAVAFCTNCGFVFQPIERSAKRKKMVWPWLLGLLILVLIVGGSSYFVLTNAQDKSVTTLKKRQPKLNNRQESVANSKEEASIAAENASLKKQNASSQASVQSTNKASSSSAATSSSAKTNHDPVLKAPETLSKTDLEGQWQLVERAGDPNEVLPVKINAAGNAIVMTTKNGETSTMYPESIRWSSTDQLNYLESADAQFAMTIEKKVINGQERVLLKHVDEGKTAWYEKL
ncbi:zinc ribbon domain-containing protein [Latilactobacillus fuchuensis]|uniref:DZANK-type domain-containing protein n=1 Tax=Latilactobacillus fuchuensis TaxID=164393 RepID=A0A2N9DXS0_9LACO|nr:zinc ribbon domain-containing protein [Latilactobacillus fuchuensis]MCP8857505.1 zinc ribbon domain-containing protein [Latilactobacillus fuchuensis]SPC39610.1 hypothetical protein LFUMFP_450036 [Latilactobacillus fuchuensis]